MPPASLRLTGLAAIVTSALADSCVRDHVAEIHAVELVAREDQHVFDAGLREVAQILAHRVGRALIPIVPFVGFHRLLRGQDFDEAAAEVVEPIRAADVAVQADRQKLRQHVDLVDARC